MSTQNFALAGQVARITAMAMAMPEPVHVFVHWSGHVQTLQVQIYPRGWESLRGTVSETNERLGLVDFDIHFKNDARAADKLRNIELLLTQLALQPSGAPTPVADWEHLQQYGVM
jgi:hypothetical protein